MEKKRIHEKLVKMKDKDENKGEENKRIQNENNEDNKTD